MDIYKSHIKSRQVELGEVEELQRIPDNIQPTIQQTLNQTTI